VRRWFFQRPTLNAGISARSPTACLPTLLASRAGLGARAAQTGIIVVTQLCAYDAIKIAVGLSATGR